MRKCRHCGGSGLKRVHRTFFERFSYMAIYECQDCQREEFVPRQHTFHFGEYARCPRCGTTRLTRLHGPDKIDPMFSGALNTLERLAGGKLYHCCFCRVQFYDRRELAPRTNVQPYRSVGPPGAEPIGPEMPWS
jgi:DNA-directed RNA polymerase subunit RPC12/RpoP